MYINPYNKLTLFCPTPVMMRIILLNISHKKE